MNWACFHLLRNRTGHNHVISRNFCNPQDPQDPKKMWKDVKWSPTDVLDSVDWADQKQLGTVRHWDHVRSRAHYQFQCTWEVHLRASKHQLKNGTLRLEIRIRGANHQESSRKQQHVIKPSNAQCAVGCTKSWKQDASQHGCAREDDFRQCACHLSKKNSVMTQQMILQITRMAWGSPKTLVSGSGQWSKLAH